MSWRPSAPPRDPRETTSWTWRELAGVDARFALIEENAVAQSYASARLASPVFGAIDQEWRGFEALEPEAQSEGATVNADGSISVHTPGVYRIGFGVGFAHDEQNQSRRALFRVWLAGGSPGATNILGVSRNVDYSGRAFEAMVDVEGAVTLGIEYKADDGDVFASVQFLEQRLDVARLSASVGGPRAGVSA